MSNRILRAVGTIAVVALLTGTSHAMLADSSGVSFYNDVTAVSGQTTPDGSYLVADNLGKKLRNVFKKAPSSPPAPRSGVPLRSNTYGPAPQLGPNALPPAGGLPSPTGQYGPAPAGVNNPPPSGPYTAAPAAPRGGNLPPPGAPVGGNPPSTGTYAAPPLPLNRGGANSSNYDRVDSPLDDGNQVPWGGVGNDGQGLSPNDTGVLPRNRAASGGNGNLPPNTQYDRVDPRQMSDSPGRGGSNGGALQAGNGGRLPPPGNGGGLPNGGMRQDNLANQVGRTDHFEASDFYAPPLGALRPKTKSPSTVKKVVAGVVGTLVLVTAGVGATYGLERGDVVDMGNTVENAFDEFDSAVQSGVGLENEN
jgi:hypothetical protein